MPTLPSPARHAVAVRRFPSSAVRDLLRLAERPDVLSLAGGFPAPEAIPTGRLRAGLERALGADGPYGPPALQYGATEGSAGLRGLLARRLAEAGGAPVAPDGVVVTSGAQQALDLLARVLVTPGDPVVVEAPGYVGTLQAFAAAGADLVAVPVDDDGLDTGDLEARLRRGLRPRAVVAVPELQNPTGAHLAEERRSHLVALAERYGFVVVEDDPYGTLRSDGPPGRPLAGRSRLVVSVGTVSKLLAPGLRVGWAAGPPEVVTALGRAKQVADLHTSTLAQAVVLDVLADDAFLAAHTATVRAGYAARARALHGAVVEALGDRVRVARPDGGLFAWAELPGVDTGALLPRAVAHGVAFVPGRAFHVDGGGASHLRLSSGSLPVDRMPEAADRLRRALEA